MRVVVISRAEMERITKTASPEYLQQLQEENAAIISISSSEDHPALLPNNIENLRLWFDDIYDDEDGMKFTDIFDGHIYTMKAMDDNQAKQIVHFAKKIYNNDCELLIVHCAAGISRSAGVAIAICDGLGMKEQAAELYKAKPNYNRDIYHRVIKAFQQ